MNNIFVCKGLFCLPSLAAMAVIGSSIPALAQTAQAEANNQSLSNFSVANQTPVSESTNWQFPDATTAATANPTLTPVPGTALTVSAALAPQQPEPNTQQSATQPSTQKLAQADIDPGRGTRGGRSYLGVAANIGLSGGDTPVGDGNFAIISKIGFTNNLSVRPSVILGDITVILAPLTFDFGVQQAADPFSEPLPFSPYIGAGAAFTTGDDSQTAFLVTGGVDLPLSSRFTATAAVNAAFFDRTDVGLLLGVGYNFGSY
jgi:hypothetical protein